jgi:hypothetical protein
MPESSSSCLFVVLGSSIELYIFQTPPRGGTELVVGTSVYKLVDSENGFYDYLRNHNLEIVGLRFSPFKNAPLLPYATSLSYTFVDPKRGYVEIYFRGHKGTDVGVADQAFGDDVLWCGETGVYALQVGTTVLTRGELDSLLRLVARG